MICPYRKLFPKGAELFMANMFVMLTAAVTFNGSHIEPGEVLELGEKSAQALIDEGKAEAVEPDEETGNALKGTEGGATPPEGDPHLTPSGDPKREADGDLELIRKALDDKYKGAIPLLKEHAKEVDVQYAHDATKAAIIEAIMEAGKAEAVLAK